MNIKKLWIAKNIEIIMLLCILDLDYIMYWSYFSDS